MSPSTIKVITLEGSPRHRGHTYGEECRAWIGETLARWKATLQESTKMDPDAYIARFIKDTRFLEAVQKWTPDALDELKGLADGAQQDFNTIFAWQLADEQWWHARDLQLGIVTPVGDHCTCLGVQRQGGSPPMIGQNLDVPRLYEGTQVVLRVRHPNSDLEALVYSFVGTLCVVGVNSAGVAHVENTLLQLDHAANGLPVVFVGYGILAKRSLKEAAEFVRTVRHASGQNYILGGRDGAMDFECSGKKAVEFMPGARKLYHTNHPLANDDTGQYKLALTKIPEETRRVMEAGVNTKTRFEAAKRRMEAANPVTVQTFKDTLSSKDSPDGPICAYNERGFTSASMVMELSDRPAMHISIGPPSMNPYEKLTF